MDGFRGLNTLTLLIVGQKEFKLQIWGCFSVSKYFAEKKIKKFIVIQNKSCTFVKTLRDMDDTEIPLENPEAIKILNRINKDCKALRRLGYIFQDFASTIVLTDRNDSIRGTLY